MRRGRGEHLRGERLRAAPRAAAQEVREERLDPRDLLGEHLVVPLGVDLDVVRRDRARADVVVLHRRRRRAATRDPSGDGPGGRGTERGHTSGERATERGDQGEPRATNPGGRRPARNEWMPGAKHATTTTREDDETTTI